MSTTVVHNSPSGRRRAVLTPPPATDPEWSLVVSSLVDLPAAVAGEITLDFDGSILWTAPIDIGANQLVIPTGGVTQRHQGARFGCGVRSSNPFCAVNVQGTNKLLWNLLTIHTYGPGAHGVFSTGVDFSAIDCETTHENGGNIGWVVSGGNANLTRCRTAGATSGIVGQGLGASVTCVDFLGSVLSGFGASFDTLDRVTFMGGRFAGIGAQGVILSFVQSARLFGVEFENLAAAAIHLAVNTFPCRSVLIDGCISAADVPALVQNGGTPSEGAVIQGCNANIAGSPWVGFSELTPGMLLRANSNAGGFLPETSIIP